MKYDSELDSLMIAPMDASYESCLRKLASAWKNVEWVRDFLRIKLIFNLLILCTVTLSTMMYYSSFQESKAMAATTLLCLCYGMQLQIMSSWQLADYNDRIKLINEYHNVSNDELYVTLWIWRPEKSVLFGSIFSALYYVIAILIYPAYQHYANA